MNDSDAMPLEGTVAPPMANGEVVFEAPWQGLTTTIIERFCFWQGIIAAITDEPCLRQGLTATIDDQPCLQHLEGHGPQVYDPLAPFCCAVSP